MLLLYLICKQKAGLRLNCAVSMVIRHVRYVRFKCDVLVGDTKENQSLW